MNSRFLILLGVLLLVAAATVLVISTYSAPVPEVRQPPPPPRLLWQLRNQVGNLMEARNFPEAQIVLARLLRLDPESSANRRLMTRLLYENHHHAEAVSLCRELLAQNPGDAVIRNNLGMLLVANRSFEAGIKELEKALEYSGDNSPFVSNNLAYSYLLLGDERKAAEAYRAGRVQAQKLALAPHELVTIRVPATQSEEEGESHE